MAIRRKYSISDTQKAFFTLIKKLCDTTAPWTSWQAVFGYPETELFTFAKPLIYVMAPFKTRDIFQQGGRSATAWELVCGVWNNGGDGGTGGVEEADIAAGHLLDFFQAPEAHTTQFTVTIGSTTYTNTTLINQGVIITGTSGPQDIPVEEPLEYRREVTISLITTF